jgi:nucleotide-binding universal stress UspA family protein
VEVRQILYPTDLSHLARAAFPLALWLARSFGARLHLLYVIPNQMGLPLDPMVPWPVVPAVDERLEGEVVAALKGLASEASAAGIEVVAAHPHANTVAGILAYIERASIDLTVMATHGRRGPARLLFGSVAEEVLRHGNRPVIAVHAEDERAVAAPKIDRILVPFDFSPSSRAALNDAIELARKWGAGLQVLHVVAEPPIDVAGAAAAQDLQEALESRASELRLRLLDLLADSGKGVQTEAVVVIGRPGPEIVRATRTADIDLVVMATHGVTGIKRIFLGSTAEAVLRGAGAPVLVSKPELAEPKWTAGANRSSASTKVTPTRQDVVAAVATTEPRDGARR